MIVARDEINLTHNLEIPDSNRNGQFFIRLRT